MDEVYSELVIGAMKEFRPHKKL